MEEKIEIMNLLQSKQVFEHELQSLSYGSVEIRENNSNKYIYVHYREDGVALTKYVGEYSDELYNLILNNSIKAKQLKKQIPDIDVILLDDAFQHRYVTPLSSIVLTDYNRALHLDKLLPAGRLRESRHELSRANMVIVTKCPIDMKPIEYNIISRWLHLFPYQNLYFSTLSYGHLQAVFPDTAIGEISLKDISKKDGLMVVTGIANPAPMLQYISHFHDLREKLLYPDHHNFTSNDLNDITTRFLALKGEKKYIITTEKDAARLRSVPFDDAIKKALYFLPIHVRFMQHTGTSFDEKISDIIYKNRRSKQVKK